MEHEKVNILIIGDCVEERFDKVIDALQSHPRIGETIIACSMDELNTKLTNETDIKLICTPDDHASSVDIYSEIMSHESLASTFVLSNGDISRYSEEFPVSQAWNKPYPPPKGSRRKQRYL